MSGRAPVLLRYRFRSLGQLGRHLHPGDGSRLFFYRAPRVALAFGDRVFMEIALEDSEQSVLLRGSVLSPVQEPTPGVWLQFAETGLSQSAAGGSPLGRKQRRLSCDAMVEIQQNYTRTIGRMVDVSMTGARIVDASGGLSPDFAVQLRVINADPSWPGEIGLAQLVRCERGNVAVRFSRTDPRTRVAAMRLFAAVQEQWAQASESSHPPLCCQGGVSLDPTPPKLDALHRRHGRN